MRQVNQLIREIDRLARLPDKNHHDYFTALAKVTNDYLAWRETSKGLHLPTATETQCQTLFNFIEAQFKQCRDRAVKIATTKRQSMTGQYNTETLSLELTLEEIGASDNTGLKFESSSLHSHFENARDVANRLFFMTTVASASRRFSWFREADHKTIHQLRKILTRHFIDVLVNPPRLPSGVLFWRTEKPHEYQGVVSPDADIFLVEEEEKAEPDEWQPHPLINDADRRFLRYSTAEQQQLVWKALKTLPRDNIDEIRKTLNTLFFKHGLFKALAELFSRFRDNPKTLNERVFLGLLLLQRPLTAYWDGIVANRQKKLGFSRSILKPHIVKGQTLIHPMYQLIGQVYAQKLIVSRTHLIQACLTTAPEQIEEGKLEAALLTIRSELLQFKPVANDEIQIKQRITEAIEMLQQCTLSQQDSLTQSNLNAICDNAKELKTIEDEYSHLAAYYNTWATYYVTITDMTNGIAKRVNQIAGLLKKGSEHFTPDEVSQQINHIDKERKTTFDKMEQYEKIYGPYLYTTHARLLHAVAEKYQTMALILHQNEPNEDAPPNSPYSNSPDNQRLLKNLEYQHWLGWITKHCATEAMEYFKSAIDKIKQADLLQQSDAYRLVSSSRLFGEPIDYELRSIDPQYTSLGRYIGATQAKISQIKQVLARENTLKVTCR